MPGTDHLVPKQKDDGVEDSSLWRKGLNYSSTLYVSEVTHAGIDKLGLPNNQSDIYAHMFGDDANNISKGIRDIREYLQAAHNKLHDTLDNHSAQHYLDKRHEQLEEVAPKARNIRDKLEKVWTWGNRVKRVVSKTAGAFMFVQDVKSVAFNFGSRPKSARIKKPLQDTYTYKFKTMAFESAPHAVLTALVTETAIKKAFDSYPPEYFSGLGDSRRDMARMAEVFLEASKMAKDIRAEDDVAAALTREYGAGGHEFLEILMSEVDRCAYNYMQALKSKPSRFMNADDFLAESGATSASLQLMYARLEEARFIDTFWKNNQPVVKTLEGDPKSPGTCVLLEAKNPSKEDVQPSSRA